MTTENPWKPSVKKGQPQGYYWDLADALVRIRVLTPESPQGALRRHVESLLVKLRNELSEATPTELSKLDHDHEVVQQLATTLFLENRKIPQLHELLNQNYTFEKWLEQWMAPETSKAATER